MTQEKSYKDTLNLPQTSFPMKAELARRESEMLESWEKKGLYASLRKNSAGKEKYILHDGPPYANGHIHMGHALNKILKDIIVKYKTMRGFDALYLPGWDCHGLPIEHQCLKDMGKRKEEVERVAFRQEARRYAEKFIEIQREEFKRLGVFGEWEKPYRTMDFEYQAAIAESFLKLYEKGFIEQRLKPVPWCYECETALADAELEYEDRTDSSVYVAFPESSKKFSFLVWTTTPWTLPANVGLAVHPELDYVLLETERGNFLLAEALLPSLTQKFFSGKFRQGLKIKGRDLKDYTAKHPFLSRSSRVILADYVSSTDGTGIVHIAPGHGEEDYQFGHLKNGLEILSPVDEKGRFTKEFSYGEGVNVFKANQKIIELLKEKGALLHQEDYPHSYPHCWRCRKPIIFRATKQWFMKIDHDNLRQKMLAAIEKEIKFTPDWGKNRIGSMVETRPEWCLSRQRYWGVPIPVIGCAHCPNTFFVKESKDKIKALFEKEGADSWISRARAQFLPPGFKCPKCGGTEFKQEEDIIDVWFDSGVSHQAVLKENPALKYPCDLYLEGSDQHRGWFQSALTTGIALDGAPPFKGVLTHGFVVDGEGKKMSKSAGNVVAPQDVMKEFGADILRLWVSSCDYQFDVRLSKEILKQLVDGYRKIRNTFRYLLGNLSDFNHQKDRVPFEKMEPLDRWALGKYLKLVQDLTDKYEAFEFHPVYQRIYEFCSVDLSSFYFDVLKDRLYTARRDSVKRRSAQTALFDILRNLVKILAPILPFTMEEVWQSLVVQEGILSVHAAQWPGRYPELIDEIALRDWEDFLAIRDPVNRELERKREAKVIGSPLEAKVRLRIESSDLEDYLRRLEKDLAFTLVVSQVEIVSGSSPEDWNFISITLPSDGKARSLGIRIERAEGKKCVRCWNYSTFVGTHAEHPGLCQKCVEALS